MKYRLLSFLIIVLPLATPFAKVVSSTEIIIIKSSEIIPYQQAVEGFKKGFPLGTFREFSIDEDLSRGEPILARAKKRGGDLIVAVGPQAAYLVRSDASATPKVFTMVLNPEKLLGSEMLYPGVSLNLPVSAQLESIKAAFPTRKRVGIIYTEEFNQQTVQTIMLKASEAGLITIPLPITSPKEISDLLNLPRFDTDVLLIIPDRTIGSEKILKYLIKNMLLKKIPVVGFNEWFSENGAILSSLDYQKIGEQTAELAQKLLHTESSLTPTIEQPFTVNTIVNLKVAEKLGIPVANDLINNANEVVE